MERDDFSAISDLLASPQNVLITTHTSPDGDAIGSSLALSFYLKKKGHHVRVFVPDPFPDFLRWLPGSDEILVYSKEKDAVNSLINSVDIIFSVDFNQLIRLNEAYQPVLKSKAVKVLIDHHLYPSDEFNYLISKINISSTAELIYNFIESAGDLPVLDHSIAECLYTGIITDTGSLSYACNYVKTYQTLAELFRIGIDGEHIHRLIYDTFSENRLRLLGYSISDQLVVLKDHHTAYIALSKEDLDRFEYQVGDTEGIVNYALSIDGINLAALFTERNGIVKVSFRSKGNFPVNTLARDHFGGGGHRNAAGANCETSLAETVGRFCAILPGYLSRLSNVYP